MIEKGCTAIIIKSDGSGKSLGMILKIGNYIGKKEGFKGNRMWESNKPVPYTDKLEHYFINEAFIQRIDNPIIDKVKQKEKETL